MHYPEALRDLYVRRIPAAGRDGTLVHLVRSPRMRFVSIQRGVLVEDPINDPPGFFDVVLTGKQRRIADHGIAEDALVGGHFAGTRITAGDKLNVGTLSSFHKGCDGDHHGHGDLRTEAEAQVVLRGIGIDVGGGKPAQAGNDLEAGHGQILAGTDIEGHSLPAPGVQLETKCSEGLDRGVRSDSALLKVAVELAANDIFGDRGEEWS